MPSCSVHGRRLASGGEGGVPRSSDGGRSRLCLRKALTAPGSGGAELGREGTAAGAGLREVMSVVRMHRRAGSRPQ
ncbi:hypothetical protein NDU88_001712 [Pleurodeles waltl]|uniref:Uncharacterized protein n=1 Tax=Pleurodeles waltl TaxID=8319 RepID=A0AAV7W092_PLEWA|nr:hypothetical protein NDU88_001712 [Pleurodeles waltl]